MKWTPISESQPWMNTGSMPPKRGRVLVTVRRAHGKRAVEQVFYNASGRGSYAFGKTSGEIIRMGTHAGTLHRADTGADRTGSNRT